MNPLLIIDSACPEPYDKDNLDHHKLGGTEATVIRIAEKLSEKISIVVAQHNRHTLAFSKKVLYAAFQPDLLYKQWHAVIVVRNFKEITLYRHHLGNTPIWLWNHDLIGIRLFTHLAELSQNNVGCIVVSDFHEQQLHEVVRLDPYSLPLYRIEKIYNPIDDNLVPDDTEVNPCRLLFASSPQKGLKYTLQAFEMIRHEHPEFELIITNPGYKNPEYFGIIPNMPGVSFLGSLKHADNLKLLRSSLCLFYPNYAYPETFGLILAEANAVGTPVLTHPLGAAEEVLIDKEQIINTHDIGLIKERLLKWKNGNRPKVKTKEEFRLSRVIKEWEKILQIPAT